MGGKPRRTTKKANHKPNKPGRGTKKTAVLGVIELGGGAVVKVVERLTGPTIATFLRDVIDVGGSVLITDEYKGYNTLREQISHALINHEEAYAEGLLAHTNTIEGFWALLKCSWYGQHRHYSKLYLPLYVMETCGKDNARKDSTPVELSSGGVFS